MTSQRNFTCFLILACCLFFTAVAPLLADNEIRAYINPSSPQFGDEIELVVEVGAFVPKNPQIPNIEGLVVTQTGVRKASSVGMNLKIESKSIFTYLLEPEKPGQYLIPPIRAVLKNGAELFSNSIKFEVTPSNRPIAPYSTPSQSNRSPNSPSSILNQTWSQFGLPAVNQPNPVPAQSADSLSSAPTLSESDIHFSPQQKQQPAVLRMILHKKHLYVGEVMPVEFKLYVRENISFRVQTFPTLLGDAFIQNQMENSPKESLELVDGVRYHVFSWMASVSAVKEGPATLGAEMQAIAIAPLMQRSSSGSLLDFLFSDPRMMHGRVQEVKLSIDPQSLNVNPLPLEGQPASFDGAIGQFQIQTQTDEKKWTVGDPLKVKILISGKGNFDRITRPPAPANSSWKTYQPGAQFESADSIGYSGKKVFTQAWLSKDPKVTEIPALEWSYFDPISAKYITLKSAPIALQMISSGAGEAASLAGNRNNGSAGNSSTYPVSGGSDLNLLPPATTLRPSGFGFILRNARLYLIDFDGTLFWSIIGCIFFFTGLTARIWKWKHREDPAIAHKKSIEKSIQDALTNAENAMKEGDTIRFFFSCRLALQHKLGYLWNMPPSAITLSDLKTRMTEESQAERLGKIFETADHVIYSGEKFTMHEMQKWKDFLSQELIQLEGYPMTSLDSNNKVPDILPA